MTYSQFCGCSDIASSTNVYAGLSCEHEATVFCNPTNDVSHISYCVNDGTCVKNEDSNGMHYGCDCGDKYTGDYCEYVVSQTVPDDWAKDVSSVSDDSDPYPLAGSLNGKQEPTNVGAIVGGVLGAVVVLIIILLGAVWYRRHRFTEPHEISSKTTADLQLEPDGSTLRDDDDNNARQSKRNSNSNDIEDQNL